MTDEAQAKLDILRSSKGTIFSCEFQKKDQSLRHMVARLGVKKGVKGTGMSYNPIEKGLLPVYDMQKKDWRMVNLNTLMACKVKGKLHVFLT